MFSPSAASRLEKYEEKYTLSPISTVSCLHNNQYDRVCPSRGHVQLYGRGTTGIGLGVHKSAYSYSPDTELCLDLIMPPFSVAVDRGRCLLMRSHVNPGKVLNTLGWFLIAFNDIGLGGDRIAW